MDQFARTQLLLGRDGMEKLKKARVAVFGIGGVGGYVCEALVRSGVMSFDLIDDDRVCLTNLNRQIIATRKTVGMYKTDVMKERMLDINPDADIRIHKCFVLPENSSRFPFDEYDYVVDAVDTVTAKIELVMKCQEHHVPIISCMGAGNKLDGSQFRVADIYKTKNRKNIVTFSIIMKERYFFGIRYKGETPTDTALADALTGVDPQMDVCDADNKVLAAYAYATPRNELNFKTMKSEGFGKMKNPNARAAFMGDIANEIDVLLKKMVKSFQNKGL